MHTNCTSLSEWYTQAIAAHYPTGKLVTCYSNDNLKDSIFWFGKDDHDLVKAFSNWLEDQKISHEIVPFLNALYVDLTGHYVNNTKLKPIKSYTSEYKVRFYPDN